MKKFMKGLAAIGLAVTMCVPFAACGNNTPKTEQRKVYEAYVAYAEASGDTVLSYEEWLETVKGPKGDKGDTGAQGPKIASAAWRERVEKGVVAVSLKK